MPSPKGWTTTVVDALAALIAAETDAVWAADGIYTPGQVGIYRHRIPASQALAMALAPYEPGIADGTDGGDHQLAVQVRIQGGPDTRLVDNLADEVFDRLHARRGFDLGGFLCRESRQFNAIPNGWSNDRYEHLSNYYLTIDRPSTHRY